jgi:hypothetical protein
LQVIFSHNPEQHIKLETLFDFKQDTCWDEFWFTRPKGQNLQDEMQFYELVTTEGIDLSAMCCKKSWGLSRHTYGTKLDHTAQ